MSNRYTFTRVQLAALLNDAIGLYVEYREQHAHDDAASRVSAVAECFEALDSEPELAADGIPPFLQTLDIDE